MLLRCGGFQFTENETISIFNEPSLMSLRFPCTHVSESIEVSKPIRSETSAKHYCLHFIILFEPFDMKIRPIRCKGIAPLAYRGFCSKIINHKGVTPEWNT